MTKKNNWLGMLMLLAVFALVAVGCNDQIVEFRLVESGEDNGDEETVPGGDDEGAVPGGGGEETAPESGDEETVPEDDGEETVPGGDGEETAPGGDGDNSGENYDDAQAFLRQFVEAWRDDAPKYYENMEIPTIMPLIYGEGVYDRIWNMTANFNPTLAGVPAEQWKIDELVAAVQKDGLQAVAVADDDLPIEGAELDQYKYGGWYHNVFSIPAINYYVDEWVWSGPEHIYNAIPGSGCRIDTRFEHEGETYTVSFYLIKADGEITQVEGGDVEKVDRDWKVYWYDGL
jgi:hypothetical protein